MATLPNARPTLRISRESNGMTISETHARAIPGMLRVLILERMLYENETAYVDALERTWTSSIPLRGFLLEGALRSANKRKRRVGVDGRANQNVRFTFWSDP